MIYTIMFSCNCLSRIFSNFSSDRDSNHLSWASNIVSSISFGTWFVTCSVISYYCFHFLFFCFYGCNLRRWNWRWYNNNRAWLFYWRWNNHHRNWSWHLNRRWNWGSNFYWSCNWRRNFNGWYNRSNW